MKVLVLGGYGFFGSRLCLEIANNKAFSVWRGGRRKRSGQSVYINWQHPESVWQTLAEFDAIVNAAPWPALDQFYALIQWAITNGKLLIETTADPAQTQQLLTWQRNWADQVIPGSGMCIIGMGVFPGISNLLVAAHNKPPNTSSLLQLGVRYNILSGAGPGMCELMAQTLLQPTHWMEDEKRRTGPAIGPASMFLWSTSSAIAHRVYLADVEYMMSLVGVRQAETYLSLRPNMLNLMSPMFNWLPKGGLMQKGLVTSFRLIRGWLFQRRTTDIEFVIRSTHGYSQLYLSDAFAGGSLCLATCLQKFSQRPFPMAGIKIIDSVMTLSEVLAYRNTVETALEIRYHEGSQQQTVC